MLTSCLNKLGFLTEPMPAQAVRHPLIILFNELLLIRRGDNRADIFSQFFH